MKKSLIIVVATLAAISFSTPAEAAPAPKQCAGLVGKYRAEIDTASRYGALNEIVGDSLPGSARSANEARESNALTKANLAKDALRSAGCRAPVLLPDTEPYLPTARRCKLDTIMSRYGGEIPRTCDPTTWTRQP